MLARVPTAARTALSRLAQIALTFVLFAAANKIALYFEVENGVSILFPGTAVAIVACMAFGPWMSIGIILGVIVTPWSPYADMRSLVISGALCAIEGVIPWTVFRYRRDLTVDLRDMKSLLAFLLFGATINTGVSAILGSRFLLTHPPGVLVVWREVFVWWIADFTSALLLAVPAIAFGGALLSRVLHHVRPERPRTITNTLQIVTVVILLGFAASFAMRMYILNRLEIDRLDQQRSWSTAEETINRMHTNFLRAAFVDHTDPNAVMTIEEARRTNEKLIRDLSPLLASAPELHRELPRLEAETSRWFADAKTQLVDTTTAAHRIGREILTLRGRME
ncbi:MAG TPA: MASE1 domain-containing protein, partial [Thermoanaerobaculia bacterium]|nr:MASE1 domain-containing protein [Thermoanaerobaculia bacterium]